MIKGSNCSTVLPSAGLIKLLCWCCLGVCCMVHPESGWSESTTLCSCTSTSASTCTPPTFSSDPVSSRHRPKYTIFAPINVFYILSCEFVVSFSILASIWLSPERLLFSVCLQTMLSLLAASILENELSQVDGLQDIRLELQSKREVHVHDYTLQLCSHLACSEVQPRQHVGGRMQPG